MAKKNFDIQPTRGSSSVLADITSRQNPVSADDVVNSDVAGNLDADPNAPAVQDDRGRQSAGVQAGHQRYDQLARKDARLREDQIDAVADLTRVVARTAKQRRRAGKAAERITENTMLRIAVDLLLSKQDKLKGATEDELRRSIGVR